MKLEHLLIQWVLNNGYNEIAKKQYNILQDSKGIKKLEGLDNNYYIK